MSTPPAKNDPLELIQSLDEKTILAKLAQIDEEQRSLLKLLRLVRDRAKKARPKPSARRASDRRDSKSTVAHGTRQ